MWLADAEAMTSAFDSNVHLNHGMLL